MNKIITKAYAEKLIKKGVLRYEGDLKRDQRGVVYSTGVRVIGQQITYHWDSGK